MESSAFYTMKGYELAANTQITTAMEDYLETKVTEVDAIIEQKKEQMAVLDAYKRSLIFEYVTGKKEV